MKKVIAWLIAFLICLPVLLVMATLFAVNNSTASAWLLQRATALAPGSLVLEDIQGNLVSGVSIGSISYALPQVIIEASDSTIAIDWLWMIESRLVIKRLTAKQLVLTIPESEDQSGNGVLPTVDLPLPININEVRLDRFNLSAPGFEETLTRISGRVGFSGNRVDVVSLTVQRAELTANLTGDIRLAGAYPLEARIGWHTSDRPLSGSGTFRGNLEKLNFEHLLKIPEAISLSGVIHSATHDPTINGTASWDLINLPDSADEPISLMAGQASLSGNTTEYRLKIAGEVIVPSLPPLAATIIASGNPDELNISKISVSAFDGQIDGTGHANFSEQLISLQLAGQNLNPATFMEDLSGRLDARTTIAVRLPNHFDIDIESLDGILLDNQVAGRAKLALDDGQLSINDLELISGNNRVNFDGVVLPRLAGRINIDAEDLSELLPALRGKIKGSGAFDGTLAQPVAQISLQASGISYRDRGAGQLLMEAQIYPDQRINALISAEAIKNGSTSIGDLNTTATGTLDSQTIDLTLSGGLAGIALNAAGSWDGNVLRYRLNTAEVDPGMTGTWRLRSPFDAKLVDSMVQISRHCWEQDAAELCIDDSRFGSDELFTGGHLTDFPLTVLRKWTADGFNYSGTADAKFDLRRRSGAFDGFFRWAQKDTIISFEDSEDTRVETLVEEVRFDITGNDQRAEITGRIRSDLGIAVDLDASLANLLAKSTGVNGRLRILAPDIGESAVLINRFFDVQKLEGKLNADLRINGSLDAPRITGTGGITDGSAFLPQTGISLEELQFRLEGKNDSPVSLTASAMSGGGSLSIDGVLGMSEQTGPYAELEILGDRFQVMQSPNQMIYVSPDLQSKIDEGRIEISGIVLVPDAEFRIDTLPETAAVPSTDVIIESESKKIPERRAAIEYVGDFEIRLGENVHFSGFGIDTHLAGGLRLSRDLGAVNAHAEGNLRTVDGKFEAYRKKLTIDRGALIFAGPLNDPNVDARASRELIYDGQTITVGVLLTGPLSNIRSKVFSEPVMNDADALSYLVLNQPISRAQADDSGDLANAALAFGLSQALPMTEGFQENIGLDEVSIEGTDTESTAIVAGKRLSKDMDIRYSYGLFNRIGTFIVRYNLKRGFVIEAGSGEEQTLDLIYTIKR